MVPDSWLSNSSYYNYRRLRNTIKNPTNILSAAKNMYRNKIEYPIQGLYFKNTYGNGLDIIAEDWDNLIILDAMRYDIFRERNRFEGDLQPVFSQGSNSLQFVNANFKDRKIHDTVYITANGWIEKLDTDPFYTIKQTYNNFDHRYEHYEPENVYSLAVDSLEEYSNKRFIIHFMQPHAPYLGSKANQLRQRLAENHHLRFTSIEETLGEEIIAESAKSFHSLKSAAEHGYISKEELREVYIENLEIVLPYVEKLVQKLEGKTVITADHGELLGEKIHPLGTEMYGHPPVAMFKLRQVPWLELNYQNRRVILSEEPVGSESVGDKHIKETLEALGYY